MRPSHLAAALTFVCLTRFAHGEPIDPASARELLKQGYALKQQKRYGEALDRLLESLRLDSQIKTLINIADCEEQLGQLALAQKHWILARDQAQLQGAEPAKDEAEKRLAALEARMPRLTIKLSETAKAVAEVRRDGVLLGRVALNTSLPVDTGTHEIRVSSPGRIDQTYKVDLSEGQTQVVEVTVGAASPDAAPAAVARASTMATAAVTSPSRAAHESSVTPSSPSSAPPNGAGSMPASHQPIPEQHSYWSARRIASVGVAGLGVVAFGAAGSSWWRANAQHQEAQSACVPRCTEDARRLQSDARANAHLSTAFAITGGVLLASGAALWFTAPTERQPALAIYPVAGNRSGGLLAQGSF
jgi:tetratricopeptide (TPR) repeat protein